VLLRTFALLAPLFLAARAASGQESAPRPPAGPLQIAAPALAFSRSRIIFVTVRRDSTPMRYRPADVERATFAFAVDALARIGNLRTVALAPQLSASLALSRRSAGLRFTIHL